ncbi:MAG: NAD(P)H-dependent glycerol-3-phosphate dehydrogenase [Candidatus Omnitrophota bacterium]
MKITVLGDGGWGTTLAILLNKKNKDVALWSVSKTYARYLDKYRRNPRFLPGIKIPSQIKITANLNEAVADANLVIVAIPSIYLRKVVKRLKNIPKINKNLFVSVTKGIEINTLRRMSEVIIEELGKLRIAVLSGPTIAREVAKDHPTTAVIAGRCESDLRFLQHLFTGPRFRVYTNTDVVGVELGGSLKNIIAIACGISDGLGFGTNSKAAILSRGLNEMRKLAVAMGGRGETLNGISGLGDLVTTCVSKFSRNRFVGEQLAKGIPIKKIVSKMQMVAEGVTTVKSAHSLSLKYNIEMPITKEIYQVIYRGKSAIKAVNDLMSRKLKPE